MSKNFLFCVTPIEDSATSQLSQVLEKRVELVSRRKLPALWRFHDWLNRRPKALPEVLQKRRKRHAFLGLWVWAMSVFLLIPSVMEPGEMWLPLVVSLGCFVIGCISLWNTKRGLLAAINLFQGIVLCAGALADREQLGPLLIPGVGCVLIGLVAFYCSNVRKRASRFDREAEAMVQHQKSLPEMQSLQVRFEESGLALGKESAEEERRIGYEVFEFVAETRDLLVVICNDIAVVLQKKDLQQGNMDALRDLLNSKIQYIYLGADGEGNEASEK